MTNKPELQVSEPLLEATQNIPAATETSQHQEEAEDAPFSTNYWTEEAKPIMSAAAAKAKELEDKATDPSKVPSWARRILNRYPDMLGELGRHQTNLVRDAEAILERGEVTQGQRSVHGSVERWYRSLGPTNNTPDHNNTLLKMVDVLETQPQNPKNSFLMGNLIQDVAERTQDPTARAKLLLEAQAAYTATEKQGTMENQEVRAAMRHRIDCEHQLLLDGLANGERTPARLEAYYEAFEKLQAKNAHALEQALTGGNNLRDGELAEWGSVVFLRHKAWLDGVAEDYQVRGSLLREDQAIYPWIVEKGANPIWSHDVVIQKTGQEQQYLQLKSGRVEAHDPKFRVYVPGIVRLVTIEDPAKIRQLAARGAAAIPHTMRMSHDMNYNPSIDETSLNEMNKVFGELLPS